MITRELFWRVFGARIAIVHQFHKPPYGGGNQFLLALSKEWVNQGLDVAANRIGARTKAVLFNSFNFDFEGLRRRLHPGIRAVHRVDGPIFKYRGKDRELDEQIARINQTLASATVFQSRYSMQAHQEMGLVFKDIHIIPNACDSSIFHSDGRVQFSRDRKIRLVASSWSDNPGKGKATFEWLDNNLDFDRVEVTFVGRVQSAFKNIRHLPAVQSEALADLLRQHDVFLAASANDPCSNALIEALSCGLPAIHFNSGGHPEIVGEGGLSYDSVEEIPLRIQTIAADYTAFQNAIRISSMAEVASRYLAILQGGENAI